MEAASRQVRRQEPAVIGLEPGERRRSDVRRKADQQVVLDPFTVVKLDSPGIDAVDDPIRVPLDPAALKLLRDELVETGTEGLDVALLVGRPGDRCRVATALAAKPRLEHEDDLVEGPRALVVRRNQEGDPLVVAAPGCGEHLLESVAKLEHLLRRPHADRVLGEARDLARPHPGARGDHQLVIGQALLSDLDLPSSRVYLVSVAADEVNPAFGRRLRQADLETIRIEPEGDVNGVRLEQKMILVGDQGDVRAIAGEQAEVEGGLEAAETASKHHHARLRQPARTGNAVSGSAFRHHWEAHTQAASPHRSTAQTPTRGFPLSSPGGSRTRATRLKTSRANRYTTGPRS